MGIYLRGRLYWYDFRFRKVRYQCSLQTDDREQAAAAERDIKAQVRREAAGLSDIHLLKIDPLERAVGVTRVEPAAVDRALREALKRHKGFVKVRPNTWALSEWFPTSGSRAEAEPKRRRRKARKGGAKLSAVSVSEKALSSQELHLKAG